MMVARAEVVKAVAAAVPVFEHEFLQDESGPRAGESGIESLSQAVDSAVPAIVIGESDRLTVEVE